MDMKERLISNFIMTMDEMESDWIKKSQKIDVAFWWKLERLMNIAELYKKECENE